MQDASGFASIQACVRATLEQTGVPGAAAGVLADGRMDVGVAGQAGPGGSPVTERTRFRIASITKLFTATLVLSLVEEGLLDLDEPVRRHLPELRLADTGALDRLTLRHVLTHQAGFDGELAEGETEFGTDDRALDRALLEYPKLRQWTPPGALWSYANSGFWLAGAAAVSVARQSYRAALRERVIEPLELTDTGFDGEDHPAPVASGHSTGPGGGAELVAAHRYPRYREPSGGLLSTPRDLLAFAASHLGTRPPVLRMETARAMRQPQVSRPGGEQGLGWAIETASGETLVGHTGSYHGFESELVVVPERGLALVVLTNSSGGSEAIRPIRDWALTRHGGLHRREPEPVAISAERLTHLAGRYRRPDFEVELTAVAQGLRGEGEAHDRITGETSSFAPFLGVPVGEREFLVRDGEFAGERFDFPLGGDRPGHIRIGSRLAERVE